jgi:hypothetical protein
VRNERFPESEITTTRSLPSIYKRKGKNWNSKHKEILSIMYTCIHTIYLLLFRQGRNNSEADVFECRGIN